MPRTSDLPHLTPNFLNTTSTNSWCRRVAGMGCSQFPKWFAGRSRLCSQNGINETVNFGIFQFAYFCPCLHLCQEFQVRAACCEKACQWQSLSQGSVPHILLFTDAPECTCIEPAPQLYMVHDTPPKDWEAWAELCKHENPAVWRQETYHEQSHWQSGHLWPEIYEFNLSLVWIYLCAKSVEETGACGGPSQWRRVLSNCLDKDLAK